MTTPADSGQVHADADDHARLPPGLQQLAALLADGLAEFANATLGLDAAAAAQLRALDGNRLLIRAHKPAAIPGPETLEFTLQVTGARMRLLAGAVEAPNAIVSGAFPDLAGWALSRGHQRPATLRIEGDARLLETLAEIAANFQPDLAPPLGRIVGTHNATRMLAAAEVAFAGIRSLLQSAATGARQGAGRWFATHDALDRFLDGLDELKLDVDRLTARVEAAEQRTAHPAASAQPTTGQPLP